MSVNKLDFISGTVYIIGVSERHLQFTFQKVGKYDYQDFKTQNIY